MLYLLGSSLAVSSSVASLEKQLQSIIVYASVNKGNGSPPFMDVDTGARSKHNPLITFRSSENRTNIECFI